MGFRGQPLIMRQRWSAPAQDFPPPNSHATRPSSASSKTHFQTHRRTRSGGSLSCRRNGRNPRAAGASVAFPGLSQTQAGHASFHRCPPIAGSRPNSGYCRRQVRPGRTGIHYSADALQSPLRGRIRDIADCKSGPGGRRGNVSQNPAYRRSAADIGMFRSEKPGGPGRARHIFRLHGQKEVCAHRKVVPPTGPAAMRDVRGRALAERLQWEVLWPQKVGRGSESMTTSGRVCRWLLPITWRGPQGAH